MNTVLLILGVCFIFAGLLPLFRWLKCKISKHHWRVCVIDNITNAVNTRIGAHELLPSQSMLVSFRFNNHLYSVLVSHDNTLLTRFKQGEPCSVLVDKNNPQKVYNNSQLWQSYALIWLVSGLSLCVGSYFLT
ncbi:MULTISPECIES: hypothetical protein [unclassified Pseudoalteromonas]|uniref:hypothetical protein n=1 Tax=unclassified Pseudoalteromonas TaxID=194690 RepID=UPI001601784E|nr:MULTISPECIES: hypothetical protein [unclassified Pseudoalteromonas]MBB1331976.1 hypothetical protein [Pseudoalteromonas sp. SR41-6]MBB1458082.1 hypothetical protein [Pseudoalteromonas sp. SG41-8]